MLLGEIPGLALDRTGVALLGALVLVASERVTPAAAWAAVDVPTLALLFGLMVVSAQLRLGGFYAWVTRRIVSAEVAPAALLAAVVGAAGALSAVLANDIVCLAVAPLLVEGCLRRKLDPLPFLLALACAANVGSAATLIGNPQNMLIGQTLRLSFVGFLADALVPAIVGLGAVWLLIRLAARGRWASDREAPAVETPPFDAWQTAKGLAILALLVLGFLFAPVPREVLALGGAAILLMSRRMASRDLIGLVDWHLLVLFTARRGRRRRRRAFPVPHHCRAVEPRLERARGDAAAAAREPPARGTGAGARLDARRQPADRRQHREHHRGGPGGGARRADRLARARARRDPGDARDAGARRALAVAAGGMTFGFARALGVDSGLTGAR
jgi:di/tricarboxylate transporter